MRISLNEEYVIWKQSNLCKSEFRINKKYEKLTFGNLKIMKYYCFEKKICQFKNYEKIKLK